MLIPINHYTKTNCHTVLVAGYEHETHPRDYYLDLENNILLHVNPSHRAVFFQQPVDFPESCMSDRRKTRYVTAYEGFARNEYSTNGYAYCVYRSANHVFYYDDTDYQHRVIQYIGAAAAGRIYIDEYDLDYTEHDTLQTAFDRARCFSRIILQQQLKRNRPLRELPTF